MAGTPPVENSFPERRVGEDDDNCPTETPQAPPYRQLGGQKKDQQEKSDDASSPGFHDDDDDDDDDDHHAAASNEQQRQEQPHAVSSNLAPSAGSLDVSDLTPALDIGPEDGVGASSGVEMPEPAAAAKRKRLPRVKPRLPPMMARREVQVCNIFIAITSLLVGPGLIVVSSMLASATAFLSPHGALLLGAVSGIFLPVGIALLLGAVIFFVFCDGLYRLVPTPYNAGDELDCTNTTSSSSSGGKSSTEPTHEEEYDDDGIPVNHPLKRTCMQNCMSWTARVLILVVVVISIVVGILCVAIHSIKVNTPSWSADYRTVTPPSGHKIELARDENGVVHITAKTRKDAMFGLGFAEAQDRLFQLEALRLIGRGTFAKYAGTAGLSIDKLMRTYRLKEAADQTYAGLSAANRALMDTFADGINSYLENEWARPGEFMFIGAMLDFHEPEKFVGADCALFFRLLQYQMSTSTFNAEVNRWRMYTSTKPKTDLSYDDLAAFLFNRMEQDSTTTPFSAADLGMTVGDATYTAAVNDEVRTKEWEKEVYDGVMGEFRTAAHGTKKRTTTSSSSSSSSNRLAQEQEKQTETKSASSSSSSWSLSSLLRQTHFNFHHVDAGRLFEDLFTTHHTASNAWAGRGGASEGGGEAVHCSDPHLSNTVPAVWYFFHLYVTDEDFHISGGSPPGVPGVLNGRTTNVRFGHTLSITDQGDLFVMQADPDPAKKLTHYMYKGVSKAYTVYEEAIEVYGQSEAEKLTVRVSAEYGPDVAQVLKLVDSSSDLRICAYLEALQNDVASMGALFLMNGRSTKTVTDVQRHLKTIRSPGLGSVYSDEVGGIGTTITGVYNIRANGHTGRVPTIGNGTFDYLGRVPSASVPSKISTDNTTTAFVWAANSRPSPPGFQYPLCYDDYSVERSRVLSDALAGASAQQLSSFAFHKALLNNQSSGLWLFAVGRDLKLLDATAAGSRGAAFASKLDAAGSARWDEMKKWDGVAKKGATEPSDLWRWVWKLASSDEILTEYPESWMRSDIVTQWFIGFVGNPTARQQKFCGDKLSESAPDALSCARYAAVVWNEVVSMLPRAGWATDVAERIYVQHLILHGSIVQGIFSRTMTKGGDPTSLDITKIFHGDASTNPDNELFVAANGPSARWIFTSPSAANDYTAFEFNMPGGNSGHVFSDFYYNIAEDFVSMPAGYRKVKHWVDASIKVEEKMKQTLGDFPPF